MDLQVKIKLKPFTVPNYVLHKDHIGLLARDTGNENKSHVSVLDEATLEGLVQQFRLDLFKKAGVKLND